MRRLLPVLVLAAGCPVQTGTFSGENIGSTWPFDERSVWEYEADEGEGVDPTIGYHLRAVEREETEAVGGVTVHVIDFLIDCFNFLGPCEDADGDDLQDGEGQTLFTWKMSSSREGVAFHQWGDAVLDPPVIIADLLMKRSDTVESESGGIAFTGTFLGSETCPAPSYWTNEETRPDCFRVDVTADAPSPVAGSYWSTAPIGPVGFQQEGGPRWELRDFETPDD